MTGTGAPSPLARRLSRGLLASTALAFAASAAVARASAGQAAGQRPSPLDQSVDLVTAGAGVDTSARPVRDIFRLWRSYLKTMRYGRVPSPYWSHEEQSRWPAFDLVGAFTYRDPDFLETYAAVVLGITPADSGGRDAYVIRTLFGRARRYGEDMIVHTYAVREPGGWVLSNALAHRTRGWSAARVGRITYAFPPTYPFDRERAERAGRFLDSLARAFDEPPPKDLVYVIAGSPDAMLSILGIEQLPPRRRFLGRALGANRLIITGLREGAELHAHELAHMALGGLFNRRHSAPVLVEGAAAWAGGSGGGDYRVVASRLARVLDARPHLSLEELLASTRQPADPNAMAAAAVLCQLAYQKGGTRAVRRLLGAGPSREDVLRTAARVLRLPRTELNDAWRKQVARDAAR